MSVNNPAIVNEFLAFLISIITFDPIPMDKVYSYTGLFNFKLVQESPNIENFGNAGFSSRNFIEGFGSPFLFLNIFLVQLFLHYYIKPCKNSIFFRKIFEKVRYKGFARAFFNRLILEIYTELLIIVLLNFENNYLFDNWSEVERSDKISIIVGWIFTPIVFLYPIFVFYTLYRR
jgi:hypothetical protein